MIIKNTIYNIFGLGAPLVAAIFSIPVLIEQLGAEKFGFLTLVWGIVGYFSLFDLGLGRALTQQLAVIFEGNELKNVGQLIATTSAIMLVMGIFSGLLLCTFVYFGADLVKGVSNQWEVIGSIYAMAVAMPAIVLTSGFRGILEARNKFKIINIIRLPMGLLTFIGPLIVINFGFNRLDYITIFLAGGRVVACILHGWYAWNVLPVECRRFSIELKILPELCRSGGWLTVSNVISPLMSYMDRFIIGALLSASAVTYYTTPQELVTKLWIIPGALTAVLFPSFAAKIRMNNNDGWIMFCKSVRWLFFLMLPISLIVTFFSKKILTIWINNSFASESFILLSVFSFGVFVSCLAQIPFTVLQSAGRSNVTAKIHMIELPLFILTMWLLTKNYGVLGSACAWVFRISIDAVLMMFYAIKELKKPFSLVAKSYSMCVFVLGILSFLGGLLDSNKIKSCVIIFISCVSFLLLSKEIKNKI